MWLPKILFPVLMFAFVFSLLLIFTLLAAPYWQLAFLIFFTTIMKNLSPLFSVTHSSSFAVINVSVNIKNTIDKDKTLLFFVSL